MGEQTIAPAGRVRTCESSGINEQAQDAHEVDAGQAVAIGASAATTAGATESAKAVGTAGAGEGSAYLDAIRAKQSERTKHAYNRNKKTGIDRTLRRVKALLTYYRLISAPNMKRRRRWGIFRDHVNKIISTKAQERAEEMEKARKADERERVRSQRGDLPCSATRQNSSQSEVSLSLTPGDARKTAMPRKVTKEPKWNGGMTHKRSILGTCMMELLGRLDRGGCEPGGKEREDVETDSQTGDG